MSYDDEDILDPDTTREDILDIISTIAVEAHDKELITHKEFLSLLVVSETIITKAQKAPEKPVETTSHSGNVIVLPTSKKPIKPH